MASDPFPRGHLIVKSHSPLPKFACAVPVPHPDATIDQLRTTIVAILTGQVSARTTLSTINGNSSSTDGGTKLKEAPLSYSEHLKQLTIHEWRMKSLILELRQNSLIAPETRGVAPEEEELFKDEGIGGFELQDEHECSLLEHGDEVNLWLRPGQLFDSLRLPRLSSKHIYGLPNQPSLDRSGTMLLGENAAMNSETSSEFAFTSPAPLVREPMEPSSHSSSVSANPDINFETTNRHWTIPNQQHRIVTVRQLSSGNNLTPATNQKQVRPLSKEKPKRLNSASYFSPQLVEQKQKEKYSNQRSKSGPIKTVTATTASQSPELVTTSVPVTNRSPEALVTSQSPVPVHTSPALSPRAILSPNTTVNVTTDQQSRHPKEPSSPNLGQSDGIASQLKARQASFIRAEKHERDNKMRKAVENKKMPSGALIVGPGVQGKVGNLPIFDTRNGGPERKPSGSEDRGDGSELYGNRDAFVSFTAASSDAYMPTRPHAGKARRSSSRSDLSEKDKIESGRRPSERRQSSFGKLLEKKQSETSVKKVETPPATTQSTSHILLQPLLQPLKRPSSKSPAVVAPIPGPAQSPAITNSDSNLIPPTTNTNTNTTSNTTTTPTPAVATPPGTSRRFLDILPPMPMPRLIRAASLSKSWQDLLQPLNGPFTPQTPSSQILASPAEEKEKETTASPIYDMHTSLAALKEDGPSSLHLQDTASSTQRQESIFSTPVEEEVTASSSSTDPAAPPISKAEKRYQEVMRGIEVEREKQSQDEKLRKEAAARREAEKAKTKLKLEEDQQKRKETLKWQMWEEVRARQEKDKHRDRRR